MSSDTPTHKNETPLLNEAALVERILQHVDSGSTDLGDTVWREPISHYLSLERFEAECALIRRYPTPFCPSAALGSALVSSSLLVAGSVLCRNECGIRCVTSIRLIPFKFVDASDQHQNLSSVVAVLDLGTP